MRRKLRPSFKKDSPWAARLWGAAERSREASHAPLPQVERLGRARRIKQALSNRYLTH
jgi:hypothetical protein